MNPTAGNDDWQACFQELAPKLLLYARQWTSSAADAEDVVQMAFVRWWQRNPGGDRAHMPLLYAAVKTIALDLHKSATRRAKREAASDFALPSEDAPYFDPPVEDRESARLLESAVLDLPPEQVLMVAAHPSDLRAAAACGLKTAYVPRPLERGPGGAMEPWTPGEFDLMAEDFMALATALGA